MTPLVIFALLAGLPILGALLMRVNAIVLFTSVAVGNFLALYLGDDVTLAVNAFSKDPAVETIVGLTLLIAPVALSLYFMRKTIGYGMFLQHFIPTIGIGLSMAVLSISAMSSEMQQEIYSITFGQVIRNSQDLILGITAVLVLMLMWHTNRLAPSKGKKH